MKEDSLEELNDFSTCSDRAMQRSPQAPNASMVLSPLSRSLGVAAKSSKSGSFDPGGLLDVSKASREIRGGPRGFNGGPL
jgi:hypothetical protein